MVEVGRLLGREALPAEAAHAYNGGVDVDDVLTAVVEVGAHDGLRLKVDADGVAAARAVGAEAEADGGGPVEAAGQHLWEVGLVPRLVVEPVAFGLHGSDVGLDGERGAVEVVGLVEVDEEEVRAPRLRVMDGSTAGRAVEEVVIAGPGVVTGTNCM